MLTKEEASRLPPGFLRQFMIRRDGWDCHPSLRRHSVKDGQRDAVEAARLNTILWGGRFNPIVAVGEDAAAARRFTTGVDSAVVLVNASTRFNDGYELGLGAEIGISTDKFHARGPCGLQELTSYKYIVYGEGQIRE